MTRDPESNTRNKDDNERARNDSWIVTVRIFVCIVHQFMNFVSLSIMNLHCQRNFSKFPYRFVRLIFLSLSNSVIGDFVFSIRFDLTIFIIINFIHIDIVFIESLLRTFPHSSILSSSSGISFPIDLLILPSKIFIIFDKHVLYDSFSISN